MAMARLMMGTYDVVILDEPTAAMDMETTAAAETLIQSYVRQSNCILILVTHSLQQARRIADEAMFFQKGEVLDDMVLQKVCCIPHTCGIEEIPGVLRKLMTLRKQLSSLLLC